MNSGICADFQFDEYNRLSVLHESGVAQRLLDMVACFEWIVATSLTKKCKRLFVLGDIFDSRTSIPVTVLDAVCRSVFTASKKIELIFLVGNHDTTLRDPRFNSLQVFSGVARIIERPTLIEPYWLVPWQDDPQELCNVVAKLDGPKGKLDLLSHCTVKGSVPGGGGLPPEYLRPDFFRHIYLGDVHDPMEVTPKITSVGAPLQINFGDAGKVRGFRIVNDATGKHEYIENTISPKFHTVKQASDVIEIQSNDFARVRVEDAVEARELCEKAKALTGWVENDAVEAIGDAPRLSLDLSAGVSDTLEGYIKYALGDEVPAPTMERLVKVGLEIMEA